MDVSIRQLLAACGIPGNPEHSKNLLLQAYKLLDAANKESSHIEGASPCGSDLYVIAAEQAIKLQETKVAEGALQMYFQGTQLTDQFLCRAYICKAQLLSSNSPNSAADLDSAVVFLLKAINFAKDKARYHFIVYNVSVLFWQMARPFLRPGLRGLLHLSLQQIVKALNDIDDQDHDWRATLMIALVESLIDAGKIKEAVTASDAAVEFTLKYAKLRFKDVFRLQMQHKLVDQGKLSKTINNIPEFLAFAKLQKLKGNAGLQESGTNLDVNKELTLLVNLVTPQGGKSLSSPASRKKSAPPSETDTISRVSSISPQRRRSRAMSKASFDIPIDLLSIMGKDLIPSLLLETARFCVDCEEVKLARICLTALESAENKDPGIDLEAECLKCVLIVKDLGDMQELYTQPSVDVRLFAIKRMDQNIQNAVRSGNARVVQAACVTQWNLSLPLLQPNLRKNIRRPLTLVAQSLEDIQSLEIQLRCQLHAELAKCEEDVEQVEAALRHIRKALQLDQSGFYHQRLHTMLRRLELSTQLYQSPETAEDTAAVIIEQARKSADSGSVRMKRSLLVKAGLALAPDAFQYVLDSEGEVKVTSQKALSTVELLGATAAQWQKCVKKAAGHLKRLGDENDRERARLWADLAKVARGQEVWDVCRVAARFCLLYDDGRWESTVKVSTEQQQTQKSSAPPSAGDPLKSREAGSDTLLTLQNQIGITSSADPADSTKLHDSDLLRSLAEIHFIHGEALIHLLQCQGLKLNQVPRFPEDTHQRPKSNADSRNSETGSTWMTYCNWILQLNKSTRRAFLRAIELGVLLQEEWIVCSGTAYLWNYHKHLIELGQLSEMIEVFETALNGLRTVGHSSEIILLVRISNLISQGLLRPWLVSKPPVDPSADPSPDAGSSKPPSRKKTPAKEKQTAGGNAAIVVDPDAQDDLKKALEFIEYALEVTRGNVKRDIIPTAVRHEIISTWVLLKQMLQQQIGPGLGIENETIPEQKDMTKSLIMLEMHTLNKNGMMEFTVPTLEETAEVTETCEWDDSSVELEVWSRLALLAHTNKEHSLVVKCSNKAIAFEATILKKSRKARKDNTATSGDYEMLCYASCVLGESIMTTLTSNPYGRRQAMDSFVTSARFANAAGSYSLVMSACSWWWNACLPLMSSAIERELLRQPLTDLLRYVTLTASSLRSRIERKEKEEATSKAIQTIPMEKAPAEQDGHNSLRAAMYGVLFQTYTDKGQWEEALTCMDQAIQHMPRTKHRLPIFKNRIMVKAKLGRSVYADIAKFREESEEYVAHMWHRVAISSHEQLQQLSSYQKAIESLHSEENLWVKVDYLVELSTWLYCNEYPVSDAVNVLEWAADILLSMKFEILKEEEVSAPSKGKKKSSAKGTPAKTPSKVPASRGAPKTKESKRSVKIEEKAPVEKSEEQKSGEKKDDNSGNPEDVIPVDKEIIIGMKESNLDLKVNDLNSVRQLEGLIRTHVMLSTVSGRGSEDHKSYIFLAIGYVMRLWEVAVAAAGPLVSQLPKLEENEQKGNAPAGKDKTQKKGPQDTIPQDTFQWASYSVPETILRAFSFNQGDTAISPKTITKPGLTIHYLEELASELKFYGFAHMMLPVLCLADVIVSEIVKSQAWSDLITMKKVKVCYDLGLTDVAKIWEEKLGDLSLPESERASFIQEHEMMTQHEKQVQHEEIRIKGKAEPSKARAKDSQASDKASLPITLQGRQIKGVSMRRLWMEKARVLLDLGYRQQARKFLNQAMESAIAFKDDNLLGDIYLVMSRLAVMESNLIQATKFLYLAQDIGGDEQYWHEVTILLIDSIILDPDVTTNRLKEVNSLMKSALRTMEILKCTRPTKQNIISNIIGTIKSRSALLKLDKMLSAKDGIQDSMSVSLSRLDDAESSLCFYGFTQEAVKIFRKHAQICLKMAEQTDVMEEKHSLLLTGLEKLERGVEMLTSLYSEVISSMVPADSHSVTLPIARDLCDAVLDLSQYLLHVSNANMKEEKLSQKMQAKSGSLQHIVNEFIGTERELTPLNKEWRDLCALIPQKMFSSLTCAYTLSERLPENRARCLYLVGSSMQHLSLYFSENVGLQWSVSFYNITSESATKVSVDPVEALDNVGETEEDIDRQRVGSTKSKASMDSALTIKQKKKLIENAERLIKDEENSVKFCTQATEILMQSVKMSLQLNLLPVVRDASLEIVEACGQLHPSTASQYLALHQSAKASLHFSDFLLKSLPDPATSQFSSLLHQAHWIMKENPHLKSSTLYEWVETSLKSFTAWKRITLGQNALDLIKDFPPYFNFVVLQHSPDKKFLYVSLLDKSKAATSTSEGKGKSKDRQEKSLSESKAYVAKVEVNPSALEDLQNQIEDYGQHLMSFLLQSEYQRAQLALRQKMLEQLSLGNDTANVTLSKTSLADQEEEEMKIIDEFQDIVESLDSYLSPAVSILKDKYIDPLVKECKAQIEAGQASDVNAMETLILLVDDDLIGLPLESLPGFQTPFIDCLCRDFSLQMSHHRFYVDPEQAALLAEKKKNETPGKANPKTPKTQGKDTRKTPGGPIKVVPLNREVLPGCGTISTNSVHYIVDPLDEAAETEEYKPMKIFDQVIQTYASSCTSMWSGWSGAAGVPSPGQWENMINGCEAFIFYGMERFFAHFPPSKVAPLDLSACQMILLLDKAQTSKSFRHRSKVDVDKSDSLLAMEKPLHTVMMLSLVGINSICSNLWHSTLEDNANKLQCISRVLLEDGQVIGKAIRGLLNPSLKKPDPPVQEPPSTAPAGKDRADAKGGKSKAKTSSKRVASPSASPMDPTPDLEVPETPQTPDFDKVEEISVDDSVQASWCNMVLFGLPNLMVV